MNLKWILWVLLVFGVFAAQRINSNTDSNPYWRGVEGIALIVWFFMYAWISSQQVKRKEREEQERQQREQASQAPSWWLWLTGKKQRGNQSR